MPDINPADLSRPSISLTTPILANKSITVSALSKPAKTSQIIPPRIDLESAYLSLKLAIGSEQWPTYRDATTQFFVGRLNQQEYTDIVDPILVSPNGEKEHLHNQLIAAIYGNVTREMPDAGLAPWVSANEKPSSGLGGKQAGGDANERRLKGEVMLLPSKDRRRIKDLMQNEKNPHIDPYDALASVFMHQNRTRIPKAVDPPTSATGGLNRMNLDVEIRKRFTQPLAVESGEFPDTSNIESRMLPFCYEAGLVSGHASDAAQFMSIATETYIKEVLSAVFSRTRSNGPGEFGSAGFGGSNWVQTRKYRRQLSREEDAALRGEIQRDKMGLLPIEAKAASERGPLGVTEFRLALEMGDCGMTQFPVIGQSFMYNYQEGELEDWDDHTWLDGNDQLLLQDDPQSQLQQLQGPSLLLPSSSVAVGGAVIPGAVPSLVAGSGGATAGGSVASVAAAVAVKSGVDASAAGALLLPNGIDHGDPMELDNDDLWWDGADNLDGDNLNGVLESCLAVG